MPIITIMPKPEPKSRDSLALCLRWSARQFWPERNNQIQSPDWEAIYFDLYDKYLDADGARMAELRAAYLYAERICLAGRNVFSHPHSAPGIPRRPALTVEKAVHQCSICKKKFVSAAQALRCEAQGEPKRFPVGLMFTPTSWHGPLVFAVAKQIIVGHLGMTYCYFTGDGDFFDCVDDDVQSLISPDQHAITPNTDWPATQRMIAELKKRNIAATFFNREIHL